MSGTRAEHEAGVGRLLGRTVHDVNGKRVGRLGEIVARKEDGDFVVASYLVGPRGWLHRFAVHGLGLRLGQLGRVYRVDWSQMDLSDPAHPRVACAREELPTEKLPPRKRGLTRRPGRRMT